MKGILLPQTKMGISAKQDIINQILDFWKSKSSSITDTLMNITTSKAPIFILHDGPPFANGEPHIGHFLNKTIKDVIARSMRMLGYNVLFVPGWDCHGLPIEWKVEQTETLLGNKKDSFSPSQFRQKCHDFAQTWIDRQEQVFRNVGISCDWSHKYVTMSHYAEAQIIKTLYDFALNGFINIGKKPVLWSIAEETALSDAEVEYKNKKSNSVYVLFPIKNIDDLPFSQPATLKTIKKMLGLSVIIWTTTPWTIPMNKAIACQDSLEYSIVVSRNKCFVIATNVMAEFSNKFDDNIVILDKINGTALLNVLCQHPIYTNLYVPIIRSDHVDKETGTGFVHIAPGHGPEDFALGIKHKLDFSVAVTGNGSYDKTIDLFHGKNIFASEKEIIDCINKNGLLYTQEIIDHAYPHSWRSGTPLIYRTTEQIFLDLNKHGLRNKTIQAIRKTQWLPKTSINRTSTLLQNRYEWCLSRQRLWGTPITILFDKKTNNILQNEYFEQYIVDRVAEEGVDFWFDESLQIILQDFYHKYNIYLNHTRYKKVNDIVDVWFESGNTHKFWFYNFPKQYHDFLSKVPIDMQIEGEDQHRGWFQSTAVMGMSKYLRQISQNSQYEEETWCYPCKTVISHGFIVRQDTKEKFSKSSGKNETLSELCHLYQLETLRLWAFCSDGSESEIPFGPEILYVFGEKGKKVRNTIKYLIGTQGLKIDIKYFDIKPNHDIEPNEQYIETDDLLIHASPLDKYILHRLFCVNNEAQHALREYDTRTAFNIVYQFCHRDLSQIYFDIMKDTLYCEEITNDKRIVCCRVLSIIVVTILKLLAPFMIITAEEAWHILYIQAQQIRSSMPLENFADTYPSIHQTTFEILDNKYFDITLQEEWKRIWPIKETVNYQMELERKKQDITEELRLKSTLQCQITVYALPNFLPAWMSETLFAEICIVSSCKIIIVDNLSNHHINETLGLTEQNIKTLQEKSFHIIIQQAHGKKCQRCWKYCPSTNNTLIETEYLCNRCQ